MAFNPNACSFDLNKETPNFEECYECENKNECDIYNGMLFDADDDTDEIGMREDDNADEYFD